MKFNQGLGYRLVIGFFAFVVSAVLTGCVNKAISSLKANGTIKRLQQLWLAKATGAPVLK